MIHPFSCNCSRCRPVYPGAGAVAMTILPGLLFGIVIIVVIATELGVWQ
jgi:hypothetical protein